MPERVDRIFLVGFMGAGKTVIGEALARRLGWAFVDLDRLVVDAEGQSIEEIFTERGETGFRRAELRALETLRRRQRLVVACGGGAYAQAEGRARIDGMGPAVWIDVPFDVARRRSASGPARPLFEDAARAEALYRSRHSSYEAAPYRIEAADLSVDAIAARIAGLLGKPE